ncbi:family 78 glycoside hydrolase catalytic domain [Microbacterium rhizosphaerae]|uniref:alpha-L-rhamnosidase n=1 Tax=Microbacterium rhizosphaerae TaxID=1678237 RepID=A0ABZ0SQC7_9MICO|nr:family 78 glycoside hydrolase catalytic domain [Microbacterium rhizosphaerae]WPR89437.1 family 78 glycoside hydrolase catalytic domain [Microbacterium rhizosphaerae]
MKNIAPALARTPQGLLDGATWITTPDPVPPAGQRPAYEFRRDFTIDGAPEDAHLVVTAHGVYEAFVNGRRVGDQQLTPGITSYRTTLYVQQYDVTDLLSEGDNELVLTLSDGWFRGRVGAHRVADSFGTETAIIAALTAQTPAQTFRVVTDTSWTCDVGTILAADLMDGQTTDMRRRDRRIDGTPAIPASDPLTRDVHRLAWSPAPPVRKIECYRPRRIIRRPSGRQIVDFGQNLNGWVELAHLGPYGARLTLTHGEALDAAGDLTLEHLNITIAPGHPPLPVGQVDTVISRGVAGDVFEPRHTSHGFRYVAIDGLDDELVPTDITAHQVRTDLSQTGTFACSDPRVNDLHRIAVASWKANTLDIPTDCPQRERWGYTGDFQIFARSAAYLDDISGFARKWLTSLADDQHVDGMITNVAPDCGIEPVPVIPISFDGSAGWGDAATIVPAELYRAYGDPRVLDEFIPMMRRWVDYAAAMAAADRNASRRARGVEAAPHEKFLWDTGWHWGEWLEPDTAFNPQADPAIVATAYLAHSARLTAEAADVLGDLPVAEHYRRLAHDVANAWRTEFLRPDGSLTIPTQANYTRALAFELIPAELRHRAADLLVRLIEENGTRLATGFLSTGMLLPVLADHGYADVAYNLLFQTDEPGWLVMLERGATTVWEAWNGIDRDGDPHESLNHYSKGAVIAFLHEYVAGIRPASAGYDRVDIRPQIDARLTWAEGTLLTRHGLIRSRWEVRDDQIDITVRLPAHTSGTLFLPDGTQCELGGGDAVFTVARPRPGQRIPYPDTRRGLTLRG